MQNHRVNHDESVKTQGKDLDLKHKQNYRAKHNESVKTQKKEVNSK